MSDRLARSNFALTRRAAVAGFGVAGLGLAVVSDPRRVDAQEATAAALAGHPLVGAWIVDRNPDGPNDPPTVYVFTSDGAVIDPLVGAAGAWQATGPRSAAWTIAGYPTEAVGPGYFVIRTTGEVDEAGATYTATATVTIVGPDGTVVGGFPTTPKGVRLPIEDVEAGGTPLPSFPTWTAEPPVEATPTG
jgi:hypothetical protein